MYTYEKKGQEDPLEKELATQPTAVFLPEKPHEEKNLIGYGPLVAKSQTLPTTFTSLPSSKSYDKLTGKYLQPFNTKMGFPLGNL